MTPLGALATRVGRPVDVGRFPPSTPFFGLEHVRVGGLELAGEGAVGALRGAVVPVRRGDVLLSRLRPELRKIAVAPSDGACSPELWVLRPRPAVDPHALALSLVHLGVTARLVALVVGTGRPRVRWTDVRDVPIELPEPRVVAVVRALDAAVVARKAVGRAARDALVALTADARGPRSPVATGVYEVREHRTPASLPPAVPCVGLEHLLPGSLVLDGAGRVDDARSGKVSFRAGDLLYGRLRPEQGKVALAPFDGVGSPDLLVLRGPGVARLAAWLSGPEAAARMTALARGTRMPRVGFGDLAAVDAPDLDGAERARFEALAPALLGSIRAAATHLAACRAARAALATELFTVP